MFQKYFFKRKKPEKLSQTFRHERHSRKYLCDEEPPKMCQAKTTQFKRFQEIKTPFVKQIPVRACPWVFWASLLRLQQGMKPRLCPELRSSMIPMPLPNTVPKVSCPRRCPWSLIFKKLFWYVNVCNTKHTLVMIFQIVPIFTIVIISLIRFRIVLFIFCLCSCWFIIFLIFRMFPSTSFLVFPFVSIFFSSSIIFWWREQKKVSVGARPTNTHGVCRLCAGRARYTEASGQSHFECFYGRDGPGMECPRGHKAPCHVHCSSLVVAFSVLGSRVVGSLPKWVCCKGRRFSAHWVMRPRVRASLFASWREQAKTNKQERWEVLPRNPPLRHLGWSARRVRKEGALAPFKERRCGNPSKKKNTLSEHTRAVRVRACSTDTHTHVNTRRSVARRVAESRAHWRTCPQCVFLWKLSRTRR